MHRTAEKRKTLDAASGRGGSAADNTGSGGGSEGDGALNAVSLFSDLSTIPTIVMNEVATVVPDLLAGWSALNSSERFDRLMQETMVTRYMMLENIKTLSSVIPVVNTHTAILKHHQVKIEAITDCRKKKVAAFCRRMS